MRHILLGESSVLEDIDILNLSCAQFDSQYQCSPIPSSVTMQQSMLQHHQRDVSRQHFAYQQPNVAPSQNIGFSQSVYSSDRPVPVQRSAVLCPPPATVGMQLTQEQLSRRHAYHASQQQLQNQTGSKVPPYPSTTSTVNHSSSLQSKLTSMVHKEIDNRVAVLKQQRDERSKLLTNPERRPDAFKVPPPRSEPVKGKRPSGNVCENGTVKKRAVGLTMPHKQHISKSVTISPVTTESSNHILGNRTQVVDRSNTDSIAGSYPGTSLSSLISQRCLPEPSTQLPVNQNGAQANGRTNACNITVVSAANKVSKDPSHNLAQFPNTVECITLKSMLSSDRLAVIEQSHSSNPPQTKQLRNNPSETRTSPIVPAIVPRGGSENGSTVGFPRNDENQLTLGSKIYPGEWIDDIDLAAQVYIAFNIIEPFAVFQKKFIESVMEKRKSSDQASTAAAKSSNNSAIIDLTNDPETHLIKPRPLIEMLDHSLLLESDNARSDQDHQSSLNTLDCDQVSETVAPIDDIPVNPSTGETVTLYSDKGVRNVKTPPFETSKIIFCTVPPTCNDSAKSDDSHPTSSKSNDSQPTFPKSNNSLPTFCKSNDSQPICSKSNDSLPTLSKSYDSHPTLSTSNDSKPIFSKLNDSQATFSNPNNETIDKDSTIIAKPSANALTFHVKQKKKNRSAEFSVKKKGTYKTFNDDKYGHLFNQDIYLKIKDEGTKNVINNQEKDEKKLVNEKKKSKHKKKSKSDKTDTVLPLKLTLRKESSLLPESPISSRIPDVNNDKISSNKICTDISSSANSSPCSKYVIIHTPSFPPSTNSESSTTDSFKSNSGGHKPVLDTSKNHKPDTDAAKNQKFKNDAYKSQKHYDNNNSKSQKRSCDHFKSHGSENDSSKKQKSSNDTPNSQKSINEYFINNPKCDNDHVRNDRHGNSSSKGHSKGPKREKETLLRKKSCNDPSRSRKSSHHSKNQKSNSNNFKSPNREIEASINQRHTDNSNRSQKPDIDRHKSDTDHLKSPKREVASLIRRRPSGDSIKSLKHDDDSWKVHKSDTDHLKSPKREEANLIRRRPSSDSIKSQKHDDSWKVHKSDTAHLKSPKREKATLIRRRPSGDTKKNKKPDYDCWKVQKSDIDNLKSPNREAAALTSRSPSDNSIKNQKSENEDHESVNGDLKNPKQEIESLMSPRRSDNSIKSQKPDNDLCKGLKSNTDNLKISKQETETLVSHRQSEDPFKSQKSDKGHCENQISVTAHLMNPKREIGCLMSQKSSGDTIQISMPSCNHYKDKTADTDNMRSQKLDKNHLNGHNDSSKCLKFGYGEDQELVSGNIKSRKRDNGDSNYQKPNHGKVLTCSGVNVKETNNKFNFSKISSSNKLVEIDMFGEKVAHKKRFQNKSERSEIKPCLVVLERLSISTLRKYNCDDFISLYFNNNPARIIPPSPTKENNNCTSPISFSQLVLLGNSTSSVKAESEPLTLKTGNNQSEEINEENLVQGKPIVKGPLTLWKVAESLEKEAATDSVAKKVKSCSPSECNNVLGNHTSPNKPCLSPITVRFNSDSKLRTYGKESKSIENSSSYLSGTLTHRPGSFASLSKPIHVIKAWVKDKEECNKLNLTLDGHVNAKPLVTCVPSYDPAVQKNNKYANSDKIATLAGHKNNLSSYPAENQSLPNDSDKTDGKSLVEGPKTELPRTEMTVSPPTDVSLGNSERQTDPTDNSTKHQKIISKSVPELPCYDNIKMPIISVADYPSTFTAESIITAHSNSLKSIAKDVKMELMKTSFKENEYLDSVNETTSKNPYNSELKVKEEPSLTREDSNNSTATSESTLGIITQVKSLVANHTIYLSNKKGFPF